MMYSIRRSRISCTSSSIVRRSSAVDRLAMSCSPDQTWWTILSEFCFDFAWGRVRLLVILILYVSPDFHADIRSTISSGSSGGQLEMCPSNRKCAAWIFSEPSRLRFVQILRYFKQPKTIETNLTTWLSGQWEGISTWMTLWLRLPESTKKMWLTFKLLDTAFIRL